MANQFVQVFPDQSGKKIQTFENTIGGNVVESQAITLVDTTGTAISMALDSSIQTLIGKLPAALSGSGNLKIAVSETGGLALDSSVQSIVSKVDVNLSTRLADATFTGRINTLGQKTMANSTPIVIASDQSAVSTSRTWTLGSGSDSVTTVPSGTQTVAGTVTANQGNPPWSQNLTQIGSNNVVTGGTNGSLGIGGLQATNAALVGNPIVVAGSDYGGTAKAQNVKVDASGFVHVTLEASTGTSVISGTVTANQGTSNATPWNENIAQFGGNNVVTGVGNSGNGIPRVTVASDSNVIVTDISAENSLSTISTNTGASQTTSIFKDILATLKRIEQHLAAISNENIEG